MSQISPPIRILLVCAVAFMAAWMLFLRPKSEVVEPPVPAPNVQTGEPAVSAPGKAAEAAQDAVDAVDASNAQLQAQESVDGVDAGESAAGTAAGAATAPGEAGSAAAALTKAELKDVPKPVARAIRDEKALVLLFWNRESPDDRAVRSALRDVDRWNGRVHVHAAPLKRISDYARITRGVDVAQSPTVVVVDPELRAETLVGFVDARTIDQAVLDALRNTTGMFTSAYLREINGVCARYANGLWEMPDPSNAGQVGTYVAGARTRWVRFERDFKAVAAPKRHAALKRATVRDNAALAALYAEWAAFLGSQPSTARVTASLDRFAARERTARKRYNRRMDGANVLSCGSQS